jgi:hypothetical protein
VTSCAETQTADEIKKFGTKDRLNLLIILAAADGPQGNAGRGELDLRAVPPGACAKRRLPRIHPPTPKWSASQASRDGIFVRTEAVDE